MQQMTTVKNIFLPLCLMASLVPATGLEVTTTRPLNLPVMINGQKAGSVTIQTGTYVETDGIVAPDHTVIVRRGELSDRVGADALNLPSAGSSPVSLGTSTPSPPKVAVASTQGADSPVLSILEDHAITVLDDAKGRTASTALKVIPQGFPPDAKLTYSWKQIQDTMSPDAEDMATHPVEFSNATADSTQVTFKDWGVYAVRVTVTDAARGISVSRNTWINVWDNHSHIIVDGKPDPLAVAPGIAPPRLMSAT